MNVYNQTIAVEYDSEALYKKAEMYLQKYIEAPTEDFVRLLWISFSLEFLLRSALAKISPVLLAEIRNDSDEHLMAALGYRDFNKPLRSVNISKVLDRLRHVNIGFEKETYKISKAIIEQRNAELHSGVCNFISVQNNTVKEFYKVSAVLIKSLDKSMETFFGPEEFRLVEVYLKESTEDLKKAIFTRKEYFQSEYANITADQKKQKIDNICKHIPSKPYLLKLCPACENSVLMEGVILKVEKEEFKNQMIRQTTLCIPSALKCQCCNFHLDSIDEFKVLNLDEPFTFEYEIDPIEFYNIDVLSYATPEIFDDYARKLHEEGMYMDE